MNRLASRFRRRPVAGAWPAPSFSDVIGAAAAASDNDGALKAAILVTAFITRGWFKRLQHSLEHVPKKLCDFFDQDVLQLFDFELRLIDQMILFDRDAL
jgi:hypothetical protein